MSDKAWQPAYSADGQPCSRERFYALACDPSRSIVVEACAGAGKTWLLVSRMLRALLAGARPHEILAITFTRKAAGEMRERLHGWLAEWAEADAPRREAELRARGLDAAEAARLAPALAGLHEQVLAGGRPLAISTFHAWFSQLLRAAPHELLDGLGLQPGMALLEDTEELWPELLRRFHAQVERDAALRADYVALLAEQGRSRLLDWLAAALSRRTEIELADEAGTLDDGVPPAAALWPACAGLDDPAQRLLQDAGLRATLDRAARTLGAQKGKKARDASDALQAALQSALQGNEARVAAEVAFAALFTAKGEPRKLGELAEFEAAVEALQTLDAQRRQQQAHVAHRRMAGLVRRLLQCWAALKRARGLADMNDLERCALALLGDARLSGEAGWMQQRLDARVRHLLIDEFQDTSPLQWHALVGWLSAYAGAGGGGAQPPSVFIVGDPKQSIYRFRRAEPRVFAAARDFVQQALGGVLLACDHTRRSTPGVIGLLNQVFAEARQEGALADWRDHTTERDEQDGPTLQALPEVLRADDAPAIAGAQGPRDVLRQRRSEPETQRRAREAAHVADAIAELVQVQGLAPGEIMVLSRKRQSLGLVAEALRQRHLPCVAAEELDLATLPEASDLIALLDVLASPAHDLSLAQVLKSPLFGADDAALLALAQRAEQAKLPWWFALQDWNEGAPVPLDRARQALAAWAPWVAQLPPHDLLDRVVHEGQALQRLVAAAPPERRALARHAVQALLAQALALDGARYATPYAFVRALRRRAIGVPAPGAADAVQLLTVHGAKGLEAEWVFLVDCDPEPLHAGRPGVMVDWPVAAPRPLSVALVASDSRCPPSLAALEADEAALQSREAMNLLYVAMTRARERLVISRTEPRSAQPRSWWSRLAPRAQAWAPPPAAAGHSAEAGLLLPQLPELASAEAGAARSGGAWGLADDDLAARLGQAVHRWLEWAARPAGAPDEAFDADANADALARAAVAEFALPPTRAAEVLRLGRQVLGSAELAPFFDAGRLDWAGNEVPIAVDGQGLRIDRLVRLRAGADGQAAAWWVLDYKLNHAPEQLRDNRLQLARYRDAVAQMVAAETPGLAVHAAFVTAGGRLVRLEPGTQAGN
ncbi:MAG: UvrD-helicase domain-containing protein [Burkholderiaceae bacterium]|nr:UvrD-helicase domain-containing protein [Burkholderiaceae bacterium]